MSYRTSSLFHYTKSFGSLLEILQTGKLYPNYCSEDLSTKKNRGYCLGIPQVCFCDIPLSQSQFLKKYYGSYAIAIRKEWGIKVGCQPIHYVSNESIIDNSIRMISRLHKLNEEVSKSMVNRNKKGELLYDFKSLIDTMYDADAHNYSLGYIKKYMGIWKKEPYCNYEENEWRYVVKDGDNGIEWMTKEEYKKWRGPKKSAKPSTPDFLKSFGVPFDVRDIEHLIFSTEEEVFQFALNANRIGKICGYQISDDLLHQLLTKVTSFERIGSDY